MKINFSRLLSTLTFLLVLGILAISITMTTSLMVLAHMPEAVVADHDHDGYADWIDCNTALDNIAAYKSGDDDYGDGVDNNCDGADGLDYDQDQFADNVPALDQLIFPIAQDCNGNNGWIYPGGDDYPNDGIDSNCDGID